MQKQKRYIFYSLLLALFIFCFGIFIKYLIDPVGLNNVVNLGLHKDVALAYRTQKFVELNNFKPETLLIGGSRVHYMDTDDIAKYTNDKVYNLGFSFSTLEEQYYFLKHSLESFPIKNVLLGVNLYTFSSKLEENNSDFDIDIVKNGFGFFKQVKHYVEVPLFKYLRHNLNRTDANEPRYKNGGISAYHQKMVIDNNEKDKMWEGTLKGYKTKYENYLEWAENSTYYYEKMVELCKEYSVNLVVFTTAIHSDLLDEIEKQNKMDIFYKWKEELAKIYPYWDFMTRNTITNDKDPYIDPSHLKQEFGKYYFARIFNDISIEVPEDFGVYIDKTK